MHLFFYFLELLDDFLWNYLALSFTLITGIYFTIRSKFYQIKVLFNVKRYFKSLVADSSKNKTGINPIKLYFASLGGMIGIGNLVAVISTLIIGGPGSLVWLWIASFIGMIVKYSEIYLGIKYRKTNEKHGYDGGPMYYLEKAFGNKVIPIIFCLLFCVYGAEVSQFLIITDTLTSTFNINRLLVIFILLSLVLLSALGGVKRLANICSLLLPPSLAIYVFIAIYIFFLNAEKIPGLLLDIFTSAFTSHASVGGFMCSTILLAAHYGISRAVYSGDIGIGYDATVFSESQTEYPQKQARIAIFALFTDTILCTISIMIVLLTEVWQIKDVKLSDYIVLGLSTAVSYAEVFMSIIFFIAGFTTIIGYLVVGQKCAKFINKKYGQIIYILYATCAFIFFSFYDQSMVMLLMSVSSGLLLIFNVCGLLKLRNQIKFPEND